ncbi:MAG: amino acid ABC transporter substrate-binding protein [Kiloniellales bacterium]|nr:amino acid ABC transporter substrate-binding protein [Kiloniellales bacterium]
MERAIRRIIATGICLLFLNLPAASMGSTLEEVTTRGILRCGVAEIGVGLSYVNETGNWAGFFPDYCRAVAAATLGRADAVDFVLTDVGNRFDALQSGTIDVLISNSTWTLRRDSELGIDWAAVLYYDGQGFLAHKSLGAGRLDEIGEATVCVTAAGTTTEKNLSEYIRLKNPKMKAMTFQSTEGRNAAFLRRRCDLMTTDRLVLVGILNSRVPDPRDFVLFPDVISKEPLGPVVRDDDPQWFNIVQWVVFATIAAEEKGVTSSNIATITNNNNPEVRRLLGKDPGLGESLGLPNDWAAQVIEKVGNYGEVFENNLGKTSALNLERGLNALWSDGGLMYVPPLQ